MTQRVDIVHVLPVCDEREHLESTGCWCEPRIEEQENGAKVIVHEALDGRA